MHRRERVGITHMDTRLSAVMRCLLQKCSASGEDTGSKMLEANKRVAEGSKSCFYRGNTAGVQGRELHENL